MIYLYCAEMDDNTVRGVVVCSDVEWCRSAYGGNWLPVYSENYCGIGWTWDGERFIPPPEIEGDN